MGEEARKPRAGKSTSLKRDEKLAFPAGFGPCQVMLKGIDGNGDGRVLVTRDDGREPVFVWDKTLPGYNLTIAESPA